MTFHRALVVISLSLRHPILIVGYSLSVDLDNVLTYRRSVADRNVQIGEGV